MSSTFRNLFHVLKRFKLATVTNLIGLTLSFVIFIVIAIHVSHEYGFNGAIAQKERIFQLENQRDDGIWESNFSRPQLQRFIDNCPSIEAAGVTNNLAYTSFRFGVSPSPDRDAPSYIEQLERITPGYTRVFGFDMIAGSADCLLKPDGLILSEKTAKKLFGDEDPIGKPLYFSEFRGVDGFSFYGLRFDPMYTVGGIYKDFPENTRVKNALYVPIMDNEMMDDWYTGPYYCYLLMSSPKTGETAASQYAADNKDFLKNYSIDDIRARPLPELYFSKPVRGDAAPTGNKLRTNILFFIAILIIGIAMVNYINLSVALAPVRTKSITTQKVLGGTLAMLRKYLVCESLGICLMAFVAALLCLLLLNRTQWIADMLGHPFELFTYWKIIVWTAIAVIAIGIVAGVYPAWYMTSFPPATALNGSFKLSDKAQNTRKVLIGFQFMISISLIIGSLFVYLQNKYIGTVDLGFDKENVLEVRLSIGTALSKSDVLQRRLTDYPEIRDVAFSEFKFVSDESRSFIGYNYKGNHSYMSWLGASANFPELMNFQFIAGRDFRADDEAPGNKSAVCIINETAARTIVAQFPPEEIGDLSNLIGTHISENHIDVEIVGIFKDVHYESLYKEVRPMGLWVSAKNNYRRVMPENYAYVKIAGGNPQAAIQHIRTVVDELNPGYPVEVRFFDKALDELYNKSHRQGLLVTLLCVMAVILSLVGVFGLVILESEGRQQEIALRKIFGATIQQILWMFNSSFLRVVAAGFLISAPLAYYGVYQWLQSFAYKTPIYLWVFVVALAVISALTILTVTIQSYRVATANPAEKLSR